MAPALPLRFRSLATLFLVSLYGVAFETFLTRYFALALFSEYSYWIISMAMLGYALGGVLLALCPAHFQRHRETWLFMIPPLLLAATILAFVTLRVDPFNPLKLQNEQLWKGEIPAVLGYYGGLFPVFFLAGMLIGLTFLVFQREMPRVYALDLLGAAVGAALLLAALYFVHPYHLPVLALALLFVMTVMNTRGYFGRILAIRPIAFLAGAAATLAFGIWLALSVGTLDTPEFKQLHSILGIASTKIERTVLSPSGYYLVVDDYTEFDDVNMTNDYTSLGIGAPPRSFGLYRDGSRISSLLKAVPRDFSYARGALSDFPYTIRPSQDSLLIGTSGGYRLVEKGAKAVALEQQPVVYALVRDALRQAGWAASDTPGVDARLQNASVFSYLRDRRSGFDIIELAWDFLAEDPTSRYAFTREAVELYLQSLSPGGILLVPVDISESTLYALKMAATVRDALARTGSRYPSRSIISYRSEWTAMIMASNLPFSSADIEALRRWCAERSFDTSYFPGIEPAKVQVWNDLPPVSYETGELARSSAPQDALALDLARLIPGSEASLEESLLFNLAPSTLDRPDFYSISRPLRAGALLARAPILPQQEMSYLVNVVVLAQALLLAVLVMFLPLAASRSRSVLRGAGLSTRVILYFGALGLGFFFIEVALIDRLSFLLESVTTSFAVVLAGMLVFSGLGSWYSSRFAGNPWRGVLGAMPLIGLSLAFYLLGLNPLMRAAIGMPFGARIALTLLLVAPLSFGLGRPFALGATAVAGRSDSAVPWAWSINGALSVVATPAANLLSASVGWTAVLAAALVLYASILVTFPGTRDREYVSRR